MKAKQFLLEYSQIAMGSFVASLGLTMFLVPNRLAAGGVSGLATVLHHVYQLPVGWVMLAFNIPLFLLGVFFMGKSFGVKSLVGAALFSVFTELTANFPVPTHDLLLGSVYGAVVMGLGLGIVFRARGSTGGTDLAAMLLNHFIPSISMGQGIMLIDFFVIILEGIVFDWELAMYSWIALFITGKVIDFVQEDFNYAKAVIIISDYGESISRRVMEEMGRGVTLLSAKGAYSQMKKKMLLCVITRIELSRLKAIVHGIDPKAFVIVHDVHEVLGEGFSYKDLPPEDLGNGKE